ncbi:hypothetical protein GCM10023258_03240 [Terrabacter aeriphilus]|uniref:Restriction endonuclease type IV Mrr domain-containing protein n=1 Tax=Terrabacter aeriphilus TaxID=515662 RepID=A0ABP9J312_9MICO
MNEQPQVTQIDSWQVAEVNAADWMRFWGHADAHVTAAGADGGIDVLSDSALGQVKFEAAQVGAPAVQRLVGAAGHDSHKQLFFFSGAGYSQQAITYADTMAVALFRYDLLGRMTPVNGPARFVTGMRRPEHPDSPSSHDTYPPALDAFADDDNDDALLIEALVDFDVERVRRWAYEAYESTPRPPLLARLLGRSKVLQRSGFAEYISGVAGGRVRVFWLRYWPWILTGLFSIAAVANLGSTTTEGTAEHPIGTVSGPNLGAFVVALVLAVGFAVYGWRRPSRSLPQARPAVVATTVPTQGLGPEVEQLMQTLPTVVEDGWPSSVAGYQRAYDQLVRLTEGGSFVALALVWAYFVHPQIGLSLRDWVDSHMGRRAGLRIQL